MYLQPLLILFDMKFSEENILKLAEKQKKIKTRDIVSIFGISRQRAHIVVSKLIRSGKLVKIGSTASAFYVTPDFASAHPEVFPNYVKKSLVNQNLEEHKVFNEIEKNLPLISKLKENVHSIFEYAFSEMLNNAIEHSLSDKINIVITVDGDFTFEIRDFGIGVFKNIQKKRKLKDEMEAIQDLLKGKTTTQPKSHSGEGIFFTSKIADRFIIESYNYQLLIDNIIDDIFVNSHKNIKGTKILFSVNIKSNKHLKDLFLKFASKEGDFQFNKTEIRVKLYSMGGVYISRSQARRLLSGLEKFSTIVLDFDKVPMVGQAFADEVFRVFKNKHPKIKIESINKNEGIEFMIGRVEKE
jgi:anti-sigma regulatory factor (Ser/Thr protein kinase)